MIPENYNEEFFIPDDVMGVIKDAVEYTAAAAITEYKARKINYYRTMENILFNYKSMEKLISNKDEYINLEIRERSKDLIYLHSRSTGTKEEIEQRLADDREKSYSLTRSQYDVIDKLIKLFSSKKEFIVIRLYYFNEDIGGNQRGLEEPQYTWEEIAMILSDANILHTEKTARRWRTQLVRDMSVTLFGLPAAMNLEMEMLPS